jgi:uncharacterized protein (DUF488 family)
MTESVKIFTIGFTQKTAEAFFSSLKKNQISALVDTRLNNTGQLAGFSKRDDLAFFTRNILQSEYRHWQHAAPTADILKAYKNKEMSWETYEKEYRSLLEARRIHQQMDIRQLHHSCFLCSEHSPKFCHRRILGEFLQEKFTGSIELIHL